MSELSKYTWSSGLYTGAGGKSSPLTGIVCARLCVLPKLGQRDKATYRLPRQSGQKLPRTFTRGLFACTGSSEKSRCKYTLIPNLVLFCIPLIVKILTACGAP
ncbi:hypothetical protein E4T56_gene20568 [Termitomyces sp. T112]|nr:hypothetical protein E4T56_gene20568 [Termitomyces sp. T112]